MIYRAEKKRLQVSMIGLILAVALCLPGFSFCLDHGEFCRDLLYHPGNNQTEPQCHSHSEPHGLEHQHNHCCKDSQQYREHSYMEADFTFAEKHLTEESAAHPVQLEGAVPELSDSNRNFLEEAEQSCSCSALLALRSVVILA